jgi:hypothetical protein
MVKNVTVFTSIFQTKCCRVPYEQEVSAAFIQYVTQFGFKWGWQTSLARN